MARGPARSSPARSRSFRGISIRTSSSECRRSPWNRSHALRLRDYARIDLRVSEGGEIYVIEVNPNCYLERDSEFARAAKESGLEYQELIARLIDLANARYAR